MCDFELNHAIVKKSLKEKFQNSSKQLRLRQKQKHVKKQANFTLKRLARQGDWGVDILIRKISLDTIGLHGQGAIADYIPKFQAATMSLEVA